MIPENQINNPETSTENESSEFNLGGFLANAAQGLPELISGFTSNVSHELTPIQSGFQTPTNLNSISNQEYKLPGLKINPTNPLGTIGSIVQRIRAKNEKKQFDSDKARQMKEAMFRNSAIDMRKKVIRNIGSANRNQIRAYKGY